MPYSIIISSRLLILLSFKVRLHGRRIFRNTGQIDDVIMDLTDLVRWLVPVLRKNILVKL